MRVNPVKSQIRRHKICLEVVNNYSVKKTALTGLEHLGFVLEFPFSGFLAEK